MSDPSTRQVTRPSPRQNRVDPWSRLVATPARGLLMGNRGCLHDAEGHILRTHQGTRWIICLLDFRGRKRTVMQPGRYTELFFLDEATALAAGHRPCAECQRTRYHHFLDLWAQTQPGMRHPRAADLDAVLHRARWVNGRKATYTARLGDLPPGAMITTLDDVQPYLIGQGQLWRWNFDGYTPVPQQILAYHHATEVRVLTPRPTVEILVAGYPVQVHSSLT